MDLSTLIQPIDWDTIWKISLAMILGGVLGFERIWSGHEAGLRTNIMIAVSSCLFTILSIQAFPLAGGGPRDTARVAAQIVTGVGFLGAGVVMQTKSHVRGITTAATIWLVAAVGMAIGAGYHSVAVFTAIVAVFVLAVLAPVSDGVGDKGSEYRSRRENARRHKAKKEAPHKDETLEDR